MASPDHKYFYISAIDGSLRTSIATPSTISRICRLYSAWIGYDPIIECGVSALDALQTLREFRAEGGAA